jgi:uncharacterized protein
MQQPPLMTENVARNSAKRILKHCQSYKLKEIVISFHGGEPLIGGVKHLKMLMSVINEVFSENEVDVNISIQSNGLLFTREIGDLLLDNNISVGISLDGPPKVNDLYRVDHEGKPRTLELERNLSLLTSDIYKKIFGGFLCVINVNSDPLEVFEYLLSYKPPSIDFLLPDNNFDRIPFGKSDFNSTPYANWLIKIFDNWFYHDDAVKIRFFNSIIQQIFGFPSLVETLGLDPAQIIVIETNGDIEALDVLKTSYSKATKLGFNVIENDFDQVFTHNLVSIRNNGINSLCKECQHCSMVKICGGGYLPHRYSSNNNFDNTSIYCMDLKKLILHIYNSINNQVKNAKTQYLLTVR